MLLPIRVRSWANAGFIFFVQTVILGWGVAIQAQSCPLVEHSCGAEQVPGDACLLQAGFDIEIEGTCYAENLDGTPRSGPCVDEQGQQHCDCLVDVTATVVFPDTNCAGKVDGSACAMKDGGSGVCTLNGFAPSSTGNTCGTIETGDACTCLGPDETSTGDNSCACFTLEEVAANLKLARAAGADGQVVCD
ncbi:MAG TPA: hypothetical protein VFW62_10470, partial [bacterium]|nr:hypothetical protein [bacterium]